MSALGHLLTVATDPATQFVSAIAQNAGEYLGLTVNDLGKTARGRVLRVVLKTTENKDWQVYFFRTAANNSGTIGLNKYAGRVAFVAADGLQIAGAGFFLYDKAADIPVLDEDKTTKIHLVLVNRGTLTTAGANRISLELSVDPTR